MYIIRVHQLPARSLVLILVTMSLLLSHILCVDHSGSKTGNDPRGHNSDESIGGKVMLQAFYWDTSPNWYQTIEEKIPEIAAAGFDALWLPPPSKGDSGGYSMGYDPYDYYDLGEFNQQGTTNTRFGSRTDLESLISAATSSDIAIMADLVLNHNSGGDSEWNPVAQEYTYTDFSGVKSGIFPRNYTHFHPCAHATEDEGFFGGFPDLCHANPDVHDELIEWGRWLMDDLGFDAWRFDYVKGFSPSMVADWMDELGGFGVAEFWDGDLSLVEGYLDSAENTVSAFDFPLYYTLRDMANGAGTFNMRDLDHAGLVGQRPFQSVTFVTNHDTDEIFEITKPLAYAYILTAEGYPTVFWNDLFDSSNADLPDAILNLVQIHNDYAEGTTSVLFADNDLYIAQRNGEPGLLVAINDCPFDSKTVGVQANWNSQVLHGLTGQGYDLRTNSTGHVQISVPELSYSVFAPPLPINTTTATTTSSTTASDVTGSSDSPMTTTDTTRSSETAVAPTMIPISLVVICVTTMWRWRRQRRR